MFPSLYTVDPKTKKFTTYNVFTLVDKFGILITFVGQITCLLSQLTDNLFVSNRLIISCKDELVYYRADVL